MKLHEDKAAFGFIVDKLAREYGIRRDVLEKDYYVTLLLHELAIKDKQGYAYFKGGTALYKALRSIRRFSEDIDLTVYIEDCPTASQAKKRLENATLKYGCLQKGETLENQRGSITCEYLYDSMYVLDESDALQRFGRVKVEATSFTISEPTERIKIAPHLYELADINQKEILEETYEVASFTVETISLERIFIDKVFAAEFYFERKNYSDVAKHVYDLTVMFNSEKIRKFLSDREKVKEVVEYKRTEELKRKGGVSAEKQISDFDYFDGLQGNKEFMSAFNDMQRIYVFNPADILTEEQVFVALCEIRGAFKSLD